MRRDQRRPDRDADVAVAQRGDAPPGLDGVLDRSGPLTEVRRRGDSLVNGALWGLGIGGAVAAAGGGTVESPVTTTSATGQASTHAGRSPLVMR